MVNSLLRPFLPLGPEVVVTVMQRLGAICFPIMSEADALALAVEAKRFKYKKQPKEYGKRKVRQEVSSCLVSEGAIGDFASSLERELAVFFGPEAFESPLSFTARNIQRYRNGTLGIEPHRDESENRNIVALLGLEGRGRFTVYDELDGPVRVRWTINPGDLLLMVAPGFYGADASCRRVHRVDEIVGYPHRYLLGLRQYVPSASRQGEK
ncbi:MAG TPA: hypothetical protein VGE59_04440 [Patescibacteria group bacterium]